jgi:thiamine thiazole synthase
MWRSSRTKHILDAHEIGSERCGDGLLAVSAVELAAALIRDAVKAGVSVFNLMRVEDVCVHADRVDGIVANGGTIPENLPVDPVVFTAPCVVDATGHDAFVVQCLRRRGLLEKGTSGEFPMNAAEGERFVVEHTGKIHPGLWIAGMSVCSVHSGPRMGPIFGGMLLSGVRVAEQIMEFLRSRRE